MPRLKAISKPKSGKCTTKNSATAPREIELQERRREALELRKRAYTFQQIADKLGVTIGTAHNYVVHAMYELIEEPARDVLRMELQRLDDYQRAIYEHAAAGEVPAIDANLRVSHRRAQLLGLYPEAGRPGVNISAVPGDGTKKPRMRVEFVIPDRQDEDDD